jgi:glycosyltransferase involved in cell wall biosynthesis
MDFSTYYFSRYNAQPLLFDTPPCEHVGMIVVIPCYDDELIFNTLQSLEETKRGESNVEVIVIVNSGTNASASAIENNRKIFAELKAKTESNYYKNFNLLSTSIENIPQKTAGVGHARKTGMDEAVRRFAAIDKPQGIIISLDADTLVNEDYFISIENNFNQNPQAGAFTFQFQHDFNPELHSKEEIEACKRYETYLRYFRLALKLTGFPYSFHTIGSCFAVTASAYTKAGGMPCRQGGEDFYFLHKLAPMTSVGEIKEVLVYPSPRVSDRVPFGTGPSVKRIIEDGSYHVYNFDLFLVLKRFFDCFDYFSKSENIDTDVIPNEIVDFTGKKKLLEMINECRQNAKPGKNLTKRLFSKFDAFFVIKFLNSFTDKSNYPPMEVAEAAKRLLEYYEIEESGDVYGSMLRLDLSKTIFLTFC